MKLTILVGGYAYNLGLKARFLGDPRISNPYDRGTYDSENWFAGWNKNE
jgi:hypothetical protein